MTGRGVAKPFKPDILVTPLPLSPATQPTPVAISLPRRIKKLNPEYEEKLKKKTKEVEENIIKKYLNRAEDESLEDTGLSERNFDNLFVLARSPRALSPPADCRKLEKLERELSSPRTTAKNSFACLMFSIQCILNVGTVCSFHLTMLDRGGFYFLLFFNLFVIIFAAPLAFLEMSLGQYTSQQSMGIFQNISPIAKGVSFAMLGCRLIFMTKHRTEHRFISMIWELFSSFIFAIRTPFCHLTNKIDCIIPNYCTLAQEVFYAGACYDRKSLASKNMISKQENTILRIRELHEEVIAKDFILAPIPNIYRIVTGEDTSHRLDSVFTLFVIAFLISKKGIHWFTKLSPYILGFFAFIALSMIFIILSDSEFRMDVGTYIDIMIYSQENTFDYTCVLHAFVTSLSTLGVGDGTLHALGSMLPFHSHTFRNVGLITGVLLVSVNIFNIIFGAISIIGIRIDKREISRHPLDVMELYDELIRYKYQDNYVGYLYYFSFASSWIYYFFILFYFCGFFIQIGEITLLAENIVFTIQRAFPSLGRLNRNIVQHMLLFTFYLVFANVYTYLSVYSNQLETYFPFLHICVFGTVVFECIFIGIYYSYKRIKVNISTVNSAETKQYWMFGKAERYLTLIYIIMSSLGTVIFLFCLLLISRQLNMSFTLITIVFISLFPIYYSFYIVSYRRGRGIATVSLYRPTSTWGPMNIVDRSDANYDERAARIFI